MSTNGYTFRRSSSSHGAFLAWRAVISSSGRFTDAGNEFWGLAFDRDLKGRLSAVLIGPSMRPRHVDGRAGEVSWGVEFPAHVFLRQVPKSFLVDATRPLRVEGGVVEIAGERFPVPDYDDMESLVDAMYQAGVVASDPTVSRALDGATVGFSQRQVRRRATNAVGLSPKQVSQLRRARAAYRLIHDGHSLAESAIVAGYADQGHMTRAMRAISGLTPARLSSATHGPFSSRPSS